jgi:hypothetical protein
VRQPRRCVAPVHGGTDRPRGREGWTRCRVDTRGKGLVNWRHLPPRKLTPWQVTNRVAEWRCTPRSCSR